MAYCHNTSDLPAALYEFQSDGRMRWLSPENPDGEKGAGGQENAGAKGHPYATIAAGESLVLVDIQGAGTIRRMWLTISDRSPEMLRALRLDMYWDGAQTPAVSAPFGDFFGAGGGQLVAMDTALFASPEGRSFLSYVPMPFRRAARIVLTNESDAMLDQVFYDIDYLKRDDQPAEALYFHAWWHRDRRTTLGEPFAILPRIEGHGRFLGTSATVLTNPVYERSWWGEGEVKIFLDGDCSDPTLVGTGTEDYIGTAYGQGMFIDRYSGAPVADAAGERWVFYRYHIPDPIFFDCDCRVELPQIGGAPKDKVLRLIKEGVPLIPITVDPGTRSKFYKLLAGDRPTPLTAPGVPDEGWTNFYREDDVSAVAYFYLDHPENGLPPLQSVPERTADL